MPCFSPVPPNYEYRGTQGQVWSEKDEREAWLQLPELSAAAAAAGSAGGLAGSSKPSESLQASLWARPETGM